MVSPDGRWTVEVENKQTLAVSEKGGRKKTVDESDRCGCGECTIGGIPRLHLRVLCAENSAESGMNDDMSSGKAAMELVHPNRSG